MEELLAVNEKKITTTGIYSIDKKRLTDLLIKYRAKTGKDITRIKFISILMDSFENKDGGIKCQG